MQSESNELVKLVVTGVSEDKKKEKSDQLYDNEIVHTAGIYVFISFDLSNSTLFKTRHADLWSRFITIFYECVLSEFGVGRYKGKMEKGTYDGLEEIAERTGGFKLWKLVGDEVLLYHKIVSKDELYNTILFTDNRKNLLIEKTISELLSRDNASNGNLDKESYMHLYRKYFDVKTTMWLGSCTSDVTKVNKDAPNVLHDTSVQNNEDTPYPTQVDFLGPDIDEGFRLCGFAEKRRMIVSPKLAYLLLNAYKEDADKLNILNINFKIVNYTSIKGVWEQRPYPIIMFCQSQNGKGASLKAWKDNFEYDSFKDSFLYENIEKYNEKFLQEESFLYKI